MIVLVLLIMAIYRPMTWRVLAGMLATALVPFVTQHPAYVADQYAACWRNLTTAAHVGAAEGGWTSPFHALRMGGISVSEHLQTGIRLAGAAATLALCGMARRRHDAARSAVLLFALAAVYLMLFSPRTENNTYAMLGPAIAVFLAGAFLLDHRPAEGILLSCMGVVLAGSRQIERFLTPQAATSWVSPLVAAVFCGYVVMKDFEAPRRGDGGPSGAAAQDRPEGPPGHIPGSI
jgi:hypothetical protein